MCNSRPEAAVATFADVSVCVIDPILFFLAHISVGNLTSAGRNCKTTGMP